MRRKVVNITNTEYSAILVAEDYRVHNSFDFCKGCIFLEDNFCKYIDRTKLYDTINRITGTSLPSSL